MKIFKSIIKGADSAFKSWKGILITWIITLIMVSVFALPMRGALKAAFGNTMITEKLAQGFNIEVFTDLGPMFKIIVSYFTFGMFFLVFIGFIVNVFLAGGQFSFVGNDSGKRTFSEFFRTSAKNFWSFLIIAVIVRLLLNFLTGITFGVPVIILSMNDNLSRNAIIIIALFAVLFTVIIISIMLLVADYARAWQAANEKQSCFSALGFGFSETFRKFWSSFPLMLIILIIQVIFIFLVYLFISRWIPSTGGGVFLLFLLSQILFCVRIFLKIWRFGAVTALKRENNNPAGFETPVQDTNLGI